MNDEEEEEEEGEGKVIPSHNTHFKLRASGDWERRKRVGREEK